MAVRREQIVVLIMTFTVGQDAISHIVTQIIGNVSMIVSIGGGHA